MRALSLGPVVAASLLVAAAGQATSIPAASVSQVLNARGQGALKYAGATIDVDSLLDSHPECSSCSAATPCGHRSITGIGSCVASSSRQVNGISSQYCVAADVCCGGTCRNSHRPAQQCSYLSSSVKAQIDTIAYKSTLDAVAFTPAASEASVTALFNGLLAGADMAPRCTTNCNGWTLEGGLVPVACASSCGCTAQPLPTFQSGTNYVCELKPTTNNADSFFSTGDASLTKSASFKGNMGKAVCPAGYACNDPSRCISWSTYEENGGKATSGISTASSSNTSSSGLSSGAKAGIGVGVSAGIIAIGATVFFLRRKKLREQEDSGDAYHELPSNES
ncbi:hypothetical protein ACHHYP_12352 [Achlya hypogyna]|uniref:Secreted protein n=1 Tax=Achlya hypogyna TaxID=1202772 RepID=A0A1V9ZGZ8_ACHHY|nr:hypothetical protein ACHHYP_12352 [Achlya hypogyna]